MSVRQPHVCQFKTEHGELFSRLIEEHDVKKRCKCHGRYTSDEKGNTVEAKMCPCYLETVVSLIESEYVTTRVKSTYAAPCNYCFVVAKIAHKEIYGEILTQTALSVQIRELTAKISSLEETVANLSARLASLEKPTIN